MYRVLARYYTGQEWSQWSEWYREGRLCTALAAERRKALLPELEARWREGYSRAQAAWKE